MPVGVDHVCGHLRKLLLQVIPKKRKLNSCSCIYWQEDPHRCQGTGWPHHTIMSTWLAMHDSIRRPPVMPSNAVAMPGISLLYRPMVQVSFGKAVLDTRLGLLAAADQAGFSAYACSAQKRTLHKQTWLCAYASLQTVSPPNLSIRA